MLFIQISFTALLLFVANVSSAPLHEPAVRGYMHADHTALPNGRTPIIQAHSVENHPQTGLAAVQVTSGVSAFVAHTASHMQVHASPLVNQDDLATLQYARSPTTIADVQQAHAHAITAHHAAAAAHLNAAANLWGSNYGRARWHSAKADKHENKLHAHESRIKELADRTRPIRDSAADNEIKEVNKQTAVAHESANAAEAEAASHHQAPLE